MSIALSANDMLSKRVQLTSNMVDNTLRGAVCIKDMSIGHHVQQQSQTSDGPVLQPAVVVVDYKLTKFISLNPTVSSS